MFKYFKKKKWKEDFRRISHSVWLEMIDGNRHFENIARKVRTKHPYASEFQIKLAISNNVAHLIEHYQVNYLTKTDWVADSLFDRSDPDFTQRYYGDKADTYIEWYTPMLQQAVSTMFKEEMTSRDTEGRWRAAIRTLQQVEVAQDGNVPTFSQAFKEDLKIADYIPVTSEVWLMAIKEVIRQANGDEELIEMARAHWKTWALDMRMGNDSFDHYGELEAWRLFLSEHGIEPDEEPAQT